VAPKAAPLAFSREQGAACERVARTETRAILDLIREVLSD
jgi:hypothetical protein